MLQLKNIRRTIITNANGPTDKMLEAFTWCGYYWRKTTDYVADIIRLK